MTAERLAFDGLCLVGFGGPEHQDEIPDFLRRVSQGRIPEDRLAEVGAHYTALGGRSPLNEQHRQILTNLTEDLRARGIDLPARLGNRNSAPWLPDALRELHDGGCRRVLCVLTSLWPSYSGCRQYRGDVVDALKELGCDAPEAVVLPPAPRLHGVRAAATRLLSEALQKTPDAHVLFTAHSVPTAMNATSGPAPHGRYSAELQALVDDISAACHVPHERAALVWQSRSGSPRTPWLEPSVDDALLACAAQGVGKVIIHPIGFLTDHVEVLWDLDHQATDVAEAHGITVHRLPTVGFTPEFRASLADRVAAALADGPAPTDLCGKDCCYAR